MEMKTTRKIFNYTSTVIFAVIMVFILTACGIDNDSQKTKGDKGPAPEPVETVEPSPQPTPNADAAPDKGQNKPEAPAQEQEQEEEPEASTLKLEMRPSTIFAGRYFIAGVRTDGTVTVYNEDGHYLYARDWDELVGDWTNVVAVTGVHLDLLGLREDGTVLNTIGSYSTDARYNTESWTDVIALRGTGLVAVGIKSDGTVEGIYTNAADIYSSGSVMTARRWTDIVDICFGYQPVSFFDQRGLIAYGLKSDGSIICSKEDNEILDEVNNWTDIVAIVALDLGLVGLKSDGTVVASSNTSPHDFSDWTDIVALSSDTYSRIVGIKSDGTIVTSKSDEVTYDTGSYDIEGWSDIVAVSQSSINAAGLRSDGTVVTAGVLRMGPNSWFDVKVDTSELMTNIMVP